MTKIVENYSWYEQLPFRAGTTEYKKRWEQISLQDEEPTEVNCFPTQKYKLLERQRIVEIFNDKLGIWQEEICVEYKSLCSVCGTLMLVRAIKGTTWLALCSTDCYNKYNEIRQIKGIQIDEG